MVFMRDLVFGEIHGSFVPGSGEWYVRFAAAAGPSDPSASDPSTPHEPGDVVAVRRSDGLVKFVVLEREVLPGRYVDRRDGATWWAFRAATLDDLAGHRAGDDPDDDGLLRELQRSILIEVYGLSESDLIFGG